LIMTKAIENILAGYVTLKNREALEEIRDHRQRLLQKSRMQPKSWVSMKSAIIVLEEDIDIVEVALKGLEEDANSINQLHPIAAQSRHSRLALRMSGFREQDGNRLSTRRIHAAQRPGEGWRIPPRAFDTPLVGLDRVGGSHTRRDAGITQMT
jgi:hypothetical protein